MRKELPNFEHTFHVLQETILAQWYIMKKKLYKINWLLLVHPEKFKPGLNKTLAIGPP